MTDMDDIEKAAERRRRARPSELRQAMWVGFKAALGLGPNPLPRSPDQRMIAALDALINAMDTVDDDSEEDEDTPEPVREEWSTYDPNNTGMWGRTNFRADSEEQARELAFKFGYEVHRRLVSGETKTKWERVL